MNLLPHQLRPCLRSRVCLVGLGNPRLGDDAVGVRIAEALSTCQTAARIPERSGSEVRSRSAHQTPSAEDFDAVGVHSQSPSSPEGGASTSILLAANDPERVLPQIVDGQFDHVVFIEAVDFGGRPGAVTVLRSEEILTRFIRTGPQTLPLGPLAERIESNGHTKTWVLGVQPASLRQDRPLSQSVQTTFQALVRLISQATGLAPLMECRSLP
jgi:hydrogenase 3 maturation protease